jgi:hypothetical protein
MNKELLKKWLEALRIGYDSAATEAVRFHAAMAGHKEKEHQQYDADVSQIKAAIDEIEAEIAKPVAWMYDWHDDLNQVIRDWTTPSKSYLESAIETNRAHNIRPLYTSPHPMQRLTDDEINKIANSVQSPIGDGIYKYLNEFAKSIETALIEKNK